jgi:hypothetical protein
MPGMPVAEVVLSFSGKFGAGVSVSGVLVFVISGVPVFWLSLLTARLN